MGPYIVDFVCHKQRLVVEVDGGVHQLADVAARDAERELWLKERGYRVLRFTNQHATSDTLSVVQMILATVSADTPTSHSSPQGGAEPMEFF
jgi:very-short-patch-repair endonuclease